MVKESPPSQRLAVHFYFLFGSAILAVFSAHYLMQHEVFDTFKLLIIALLSPLFALFLVLFHRHGIQTKTTVLITINGCLMAIVGNLAFSAFPPEVDNIEKYKGVLVAIEFYACVGLFIALLILRSRSTKELS